MKITKEFSTIALIMLTEVLGWTIILPFLPYYALEFGASPLVVGLILSSFSVFQFISAPIIGKLSDKYGRKPLLMISQFSTFVGFIILGFANSLFMIFLSRVVDGLFGSNMTLSNAYVTDITKGKDRAKAFAYLGVVFSIGFFIGPAVGGFLAVIDYSIPSFLAAGMTLISIILTFLLLKETVKVEKEVELKLNDFFPMKSFIKGITNKQLRCIFIEFFLFITGFTIITSSLALYMDAQLGLGPEQVGIVFMAIAVVRLIFQPLVIPKLLNRFDERPLMVLGLSINATAMFGFYFVDSLAMLYIGSALFAIGGSLSRPMMVSIVSEKSGEGRRGEYMGVFDSLGSIAQIIGPIVGGYIITVMYPGTVGLIAGALVVAAIAVELSQMMNKRILCKPAER